MKAKQILIVDDDRRIREMLVQTLDSPDAECRVADCGELALFQLQERDFDLVLLDVVMPGMDGTEVLARIGEIRPDIPVVIMTAHGTIKTATEAIQGGAVSFIEKPFTPDEIRGLVSRLLKDRSNKEKVAGSYQSSLSLANRCISMNHLEAAAEHVRKALAIDPGRPEAFNLLGAVTELEGEPVDAQRHYRAALSLDPSYAPALKNLQRLTSWRGRRRGSIIL